jgi:RNA polymerase sigma-70 factor, ECF subfamily
MKLVARGIGELGSAGNRFGDGQEKLAAGQVDPRLIVLLKDDSATEGQYRPVKAGRRPMSNTDTRGSIIVGVSQNDPERWREFDNIYTPILFAYLRKQGLKDSDVKDVIQDVFVKLLRKIQTYDSARCRFRTWLFKVAQHTLIDHARRRATHKKAMEGWAVQMLKAGPSDSVKMERQWNMIHREKILAYALKVVRARVSSKAWACFDQRLLGNRPAALIAAELKIERNAVYVHACRVMKLVRDVCDEFDEDTSSAFESDRPVPDLLQG